MISVLKIVGSIVLVAILVPIVFYVCLELWGDWNDEWSGYNASGYISDGYCNIAVVPISGEIFSYGSSYDEGTEVVSTNMGDTMDFLYRAKMEEGILGTLALIDSGGGSPAAGQLIADELMAQPHPTAAYVVDRGASAAYLIATGADTIIASPFADVGSLGVTMSYLDYAQQNLDSGITFNQLSSAKYKDYTNPEKPLTDDERSLLERDLAIWHQELINQVAFNREMPRDAVAALADGSSMPAKLALEAKLIDAIGNKDTVREWFANQLNLTPEDIVFCN